MSRQSVLGSLLPASLLDDNARMAILAMFLAAIVVLLGAATAAHSADLGKPGQTFRDCPDCPDMVIVPAGRFTMGSPPREPERGNHEGPQRAVAVNGAFAIGRHEVTRAQFAAFSRETPAGGQGPGCVVWIAAAADFKRNETLRDGRAPGYPQGDDHPAVCVSWDEARAYAEWLSRKTGKRYRLLSEAEWEYAARAGTLTSRPWGDDPANACRQANLADETFVHDVRRSQKWYEGWHACRDGYAYTAPVGRLEPNAFGLHDMIGNAWEWVEDCWNESHAGAPDDSGPRRTGDCARRVYRGGGWRSYPQFGRSAQRSRAEPGLQHALIGFRVARALD